MFRKLNILVPTFLAVFALLASAASAASKGTIPSCTATDTSVWNAIETEMTADKLGLVLAIDVDRLLNAPNSANWTKAIKGYSKPGAVGTDNDPFDSATATFATKRAITISVLVANPTICWEVGGDWKCITY